MVVGSGDLLGIWLFSRELQRRLARNGAFFFCGHLQGRRRRVAVKPSPQAKFFLRPRSVSRLNANCREKQSEEKSYRKNKTEAGHRRRQFCLTSEMSHAWSRRAACGITIWSLRFHFGSAFESTRRDGSTRWLWRLVRPLAPFVEALAMVRKSSPRCRSKETRRSARCARRTACAGKGPSSVVNRRALAHVWRRLAGSAI